MNKPTDQERANAALIQKELTSAATNKKLVARYRADAIDPKLQKFRVECTYALKLVRSSKKLKLCRPDTVLQCVKDTARLGLSLNPNQENVYLIPREMGKGSGKFACTLYTSWRGFKSIGLQLGAVVALDAQAVYENEPCEIRKGTSPEVRHTVILDHAKRGAIVGAYSIAHRPHGLPPHVEYMDLDELYKVRAASEYSGPGSIWEKWFGEMCRKSVSRRGAKHWCDDPRLEGALAIIDKYEGIDTSESAPEMLTEDQRLTLHARLTEAGMDGEMVGRVLTKVGKVLGEADWHNIPTARFGEAEGWVGKAIAAQGERRN